MPRVGVRPLGTWNDGYEYLGTLPEGASELRYAVTSSEVETADLPSPVRRSREVYEEITVPLVTHHSLAPALTPVHALRFEGLLLKTKDFEVAPYLGQTRQFVLPGFHGLEPALEVLGEDVTFAFRVDVLRGERIIGTARAWYSITRYPGGYPTVRPYGDMVMLQDVDEAELLREDPTDPLILRFTSDPAMALHDHDHNRYWDGELVVPLTVRGGISITHISYD